jgi:hypothetical protein
MSYQNIAIHNGYQISIPGPEVGRFFPINLQARVSCFYRRINNTPPARPGGALIESTSEQHGTNQHSGRKTKSWTQTERRSWIRAR